MHDLIIKFLRLGLQFLKADPQDQAAIAALTAERDSLKAELAQTQANLAAAEANDPTPDQQNEINSLLAEFQAVVPA
jgi:capsule polysaccharide export protein KpsE/RkpR